MPQSTTGIIGETPKASETANDKTANIAVKISFTPDFPIFISACTSSAHTATLIPANACFTYLFSDTRSSIPAIAEMIIIDGATTPSRCV